MSSFCFKKIMGPTYHTPLPFFLFLSSLSLSHGGAGAGGGWRCERRRRAQLGRQRRRVQLGGEPLSAKPPPRHSRFSPFLPLLPPGLAVVVAKEPPGRRAGRESSDGGGGGISDGGGPSPLLPPPTRATQPRPLPLAARCQPTPPARHARRRPETRSPCSSSCARSRLEAPIHSRRPLSLAAD